MRVVLVATYPDRQRLYGNLGKVMVVPMSPLNLAYIAAMLESRSIPVEAVDACAMRLERKQLLEEIARRRPDVVGMSCTTPEFPEVREVARAIRRALPDAKIVLGNVHASVFADDILRDGLADVVVHGEGEHAMVELVEAFEGKRSLASVAGITYRESGVPVRTGPRPPADLDALPFPAWHLFPWKKYELVPLASMHRPIRRPALLMSASRGCPYKCSFCSVPRYDGRRRARSAKNIVDEVEQLVERYRIHQIAFYDAIFPFARKEGLAFCDEMVARGLHKEVVWVTETRVDLMSRELLQRMREAGCRRVMYGIEAGTQEMLDGMKKGSEVSEAVNAIRWTREASIQTVGLFVLGFPGETRESALRTIEFSRSLDLDFANFSIAVPYPGTEFFDLLVAEGRLKIDENTDWLAFSVYNQDPRSIVHVPNGFTAEELLALQRRAFLGFYLRPRLIARHLFKIRSLRPVQMARGAFALIAS